MSEDTDWDDLDDIQASKPDAEPGETPTEQELEEKDPIELRMKYGPFYDIDSPTDEED